MTRLASVAWLLFACLLLAACSSAPDEPGEADDDPGTWPLTGRPVSAGTSTGPVLVVKVDNTAAAAPQQGLGAADVVIEELVEGGLTRLAVLLHSELPDAVEPVRSMRTTDIGLVAPTGGVLVASGGAGTVLDQIDAAGITVWTLGNAGMGRDPSRDAPYNVALDPAAALSSLADEPNPPQPPTQDLFEFGEPPTDPTGSPAANQATVQFSASTTVRWSWTADGGWVRDSDLAEPAFAPDTLLLLRVEVADAGYQDPAGNPVPETVTEGSGPGVLLHDGQAVDVTWSKPEPADTWKLTGADGEPVLVPPGRTYLALVPTSGDVSLG